MQKKHFVFTKHVFFHSFGTDKILFPSLTEIFGSAGTQKIILLLLSLLKYRVSRARNPTTQVGVALATFDSTRKLHFSL